MIHLVVLSLLLLVPAAHADQASFATVVETVGLTSLEPQHTNLVVGMTLDEGDRVTVMASSRLRLRLSGGAVIQVGPNSELLLKRNADGTPLLRLPHGELLLVSRSAFEVAVRTAQLKFKVAAGIFFLAQQGDQPAYVCVHHGKAAAVWPFGAERLGETHGDGVSIDPMRSGFTTAPKPGGYTDAEVTALRALL